MVDIGDQPPVLEEAAATAPAAMVDTGDQVDTGEQPAVVDEAAVPAPVAMVDAGDQPPAPEEGTAPASSDQAPVLQSSGATASSATLDNGHKPPTLEEADATASTQPSADATPAPALPVMTFSGRLLYVTSAEECAEACAELEGMAKSSGQPAALGLAIQRRFLPEPPSQDAPKPPIATVQLAASELAAVFQLNGSVPEALCSLLQQPEVLKVGVGVEYTARKLEAEREVRVRGILELNELVYHARGLGESGALRRRSLRALCEEMLGQQLAEVPDVRCSDWEAAPLTEAQLAYAANGAWAPLLCFSQLHSRTPAALAQALKPCQEIVPSPRKRAHDSADSAPVGVTDAPANLPPSKRCVYRMFYESGLAPERIAELRGIQKNTVLGYLADAVAAGYAYDLGHFDLSEADQVTITEALFKVAQEEPKVNVKTVKESLPEHIDFWAIRLMRAHLTRSGQLPTVQGAAGDQGASQASQASQPSQGCSGAAPPCEANPVGMEP